MHSPGLHQTPKSAVRQQDVPFQPSCNPPPFGGGTVTWPKKHRKYWAPKVPKKILQGAEGTEADLQCDTMVQSRDWWGDYMGGGGG